MRPGVASHAFWATGALALALATAAQGQQIHRYPFEAREVALIKGTTDVNVREIAHDITDATSRGGQFSEHLQFVSEQGSSIYYYYPTSRAPVIEDLSVHLWVKGNRPGAQLMVRVVLPKEHTANNLDEPLTILLRGDTYQTVSRWQQLDVRRPLNLMNKQQQVLREQLKRDVDIRDAYVDRIVLNAYSGPGMTEIWVDDLEIGPVSDKVPAMLTNRGKDQSSPNLQMPSGNSRPPNRAPVVELTDGQLKVNGRKIFPRAIRVTDAPLKALRDANFNMVFLNANVAPAILDEASQLGFWVAPMLHSPEEGLLLTKPDLLQQTINRFQGNDGILFYDLGDGLTYEQADLVSSFAKQVRGLDPNRPLAADIWDGYRTYARSIDLQGAHRWPLYTGLELSSYREWLNQRRLLGRSGAFQWTWIQTHLPEWYSNLVYDQPTSNGFDEPVGPQPEQIRLLTYLALSAGSRGLGFWSDRFLADSHQGRDRLLEVALLNLELKMLESLLVTTSDDPIWIPTSEPEVKAAVFRRSNGGMLVFPMWLGKGAQCVPGQSAAAQLKMVIPSTPAGSEPWEIAPGMVTMLTPERVPGGTQITLREFGLTTAIVFTADNGPNGLLVRLQDQAKQNGKRASELARDLAEESIRKVGIVYNKLVQAGHALPDGTQLMDRANTLLQKAKESYARGQYRDAYADADRALRPLRILMREEWKQATKDLCSPVASPYALSYFTLPQHWQFMERLKQQTFGENLLTDGDFEQAAPKSTQGWLTQEAKLDAVDFVSRRVTDAPKKGKQCMMLQINSTDKENPPVALERAFLAVHSAAVTQPPGSWVRVSCWVRIPKPITASVDGVLFYDSGAGEPLAVRMTAPTGWKELVLYRKVPASGQIHATLAITGLGTAYFDDVRIEPAIAKPSNP